MFEIKSHHDWTFNKNFIGIETPNKHFDINRDAIALVETSTHVSYMHKYPYEKLDENPMVEFTLNPMRSIAFIFIDGDLDTDEQDRWSAFADFAFELDLFLEGKEIPTI